MPPQHPHVRHRIAAHVVVAAAVAVVTVVVLTRPEPLALRSDNATLRHPLLVDAARQLADGRLPHWTDGRWGGAPLMADPNLGALYLPHYVGYAATAFPHQRAIDITVCVHLLVLAIGMLFLLMDGLGLGAPAAIAGTVFLAGNPTMAFVATSFEEYWAALAWWPWLLGATIRFARTFAPTPGVAVACLLAVQVYAGYPQFALYSGLVALGWVVVCPGRSRGRRCALAAVVGLGSVALAAPQVLSGLDFAAGSIRGEGDAQTRMALLDAFALGQREWANLVTTTPGGFPAKVPPVVVLLAVLGGIERAFASRFLLAASTLALVLATGPTPLYRLMHALPPFSFFGGPVKFFYLAVFLVSILAAIGAQRLWTLRSGWGRVAAVACGALGAPAAWSLASPAAWIGLALLAVPPLLPPRRLAAATLAASVLAALAFASAVGLRASPFSRGAFEVLLRRPPPMPAEGGRVLAVRSLGASAQVGLNFGALWNIPSFNGVGPLVQYRYARVFEPIDVPSLPALVRAVGADPIIVERGSSAAAILDAAGLPSEPWEQLRIFRSPPPPRYVLAPRVRFASEDAALDAARRGLALTEEEVMIEADATAGPAQGDRHGTLQVLAVGRGSVRLRVAVRTATWLVVREPYLPHWTAHVDGVPVPVHAAGGLFLGLPVAAGDHEVALRYHDPGLFRGAWAALLALLLLPMALRRLRPIPDPGLDLARRPPLQARDDGA